MITNNKLNKDFLILYIWQICQNRRFLNDERVTNKLLGSASNGERKGLSEFFEVYSEYVDSPQIIEGGSINLKIEYINKTLCSYSKKETAIELSKRPEKYFDI